MRQDEAGRLEAIEAGERNREIYKRVQKLGAKALAERAQDGTTEEEQLAKLTARRLEMEEMRVKLHEPIQRVGAFI